jgi:hypothetical protein
MTPMAHAQFMYHLSCSRFQRGTEDLGIEDVSHRGQRRFRHGDGSLFLLGATHGRRGHRQRVSKKGPMFTRLIEQSTGTGAQMPLLPDLCTPVHFIGWDRHEPGKLRFSMGRVVGVNQARTEIEMEEFQEFVLADDSVEPSANHGPEPIQFDYDPLEREDRDDFGGTGDRMP